MTRSLPRPTISTIWLLFGACAFGFVLGFVLLVANSRPASALDVPKIDVTGVVRDPVGTVAEVAPNIPLPEAADRNAETPGTATVTPPPVELPPVELPPVELPKVELNQVVPVAAHPSALPAVQLPTIDLGRVDVRAGSGPLVRLPSVDLGSIDAGLGGVLPEITLPRADLGAIAGDHVDLPSVEIPAPSRAPVVPPTSLHLPPVDLGGAARRLQAPTDAPYPLIPGGASALPPPTPAPLAHAVRSASAPVPHDAAPYDAVPADAPASPAAPAPSSSSDSGGTRAPTFVFNFAVLLATIALGHELSRRIALLDHVPTSQFLTVLIERPG